MNPKDIVVVLVCIGAGFLGSCWWQGLVILLGLFIIFAIIQPRMWCMIGLHSTGFFGGEDNKGNIGYAVMCKRKGCSWHDPL